MGGEKKDLTIMFSDIRSFTTFSERMDAKALAGFLNDYLGIMTKIVFANEGTWTSTSATPSWHSGGHRWISPIMLDSCKAPMAMMKALQKTKSVEERLRVDVNIGVGINSGPVNVGNMGSSDNFSYTVIGDHVNLSSRLEGLTKAYGVAILTTALPLMRSQAQGMLCRHIACWITSKVKGKKNAVELIQVFEQEMPADLLELFHRGRELYSQQKWTTNRCLYEGKCSSS